VGSSPREWQQRMLASANAATAPKTRPSVRDRRPSVEGRRPSVQGVPDIVPPFRSRRRSFLSDLALRAPEPDTDRYSEPRSFPRRRSSLTVGATHDARIDVDETAASAKCVVHPFSEPRFYWDVLVLLWVGYSAIMLPLQVSEIASRDSVALLVADQICTAIFVLDMLVTMRTGYLDVKARTIVMSPKAIFCNYARTWLVLDALATLPFDLMSLSFAGVDSASIVFQVLRLLRLLRVSRLPRILSRLELRSGLKTTQSTAIHFGLTSTFVAHLSACLWYAAGVEAHGGTWVGLKDPLDLWSPTDAYVASIYWAIQTMSTIGYGDMQANSTHERLVAMVAMFCGSCVYAYGITSVISSMSGKDELQRRLTAQKDQLNRYMSTMDVPKELRQKLRVYFVHYQNAADTFNERDVLAMLSPGLRRSLCGLANAPLLRKVSFFEHAEEQCVTEMAQLLVPNLYVPEEEIIVVGAVGEEMYIIKNGSVSVFISNGPNQRQQLATLSTGSFFGEGALLKGTSARRAANVSAVSYSLIYSLHVEALAMLLARYPKVRGTIEEIALKRERETMSMTSRLGPPGGKAPGGKTRSAPAADDDGAPTALDGASADPPEKVVYASGTGVDYAGEDRRDELHHWLGSLFLEEYHKALVVRGYDGLHTIDAMTAADLDQLIGEIKILPGHAVVLRRAHAARLAALAPGLADVSRGSAKSFFPLRRPSGAASPANSRRPSATEKKFSPATSRRPSATTSPRGGASSLANRQPSAPDGLTGPQHPSREIEYQA